jgi:hypothetical protein
MVTHLFEEVVCFGSFPAPHHAAPHFTLGKTSAEKNPKVGDHCLAIRYDDVLFLAPFNSRFFESLQSQPVGLQSPFNVFEFFWSFADRSNELDEDCETLNESDAARARGDRVHQSNSCAKDCFTQPKVDVWVVSSDHDQAGSGIVAVHDC